MSEEAKQALRDAADYLEGFKPLPGTFAGMSNVKAAAVSLRMCVNALRERAGDAVSTERPATDDELAQVE